MIPPGTIAAMVPSRKVKLRIWAIRSVIVIVAAYIFVASGVGAWFIWAAWGYVALTLVLSFVLTRPQSGYGSDGDPDGDPDGKADGEADGGAEAEADGGSGSGSD